MAVRAPHIPLPKVVGAGQGETRRVGGHVIAFKALADETAGAYSLFETLTAPGQGTPAHIQHYDDEAWYVLVGTYEARIGEQTLRLGAGCYALVPRGTLHAYRNTGDAPARLLLLTSPGGIQERYFAEVGERVRAQPGPAAPADGSGALGLAAAAEKYGIEFPPPPPPGDPTAA